MDLILSFIVFMACVLSCVILNKTVVYALLAGAVLFCGVALKRKHTPSQLWKYSVDGIKTSIVVIKLMVLIGCLTALWRASGTIAFFVYYGVSIITPSMFVMVSFLLCCMMSYFLGSSFGTISTAGVMLMILARSGGADEIITAGAIMSGAYFGDRSSPVSSAAFLTATLTDIDPGKNVKMLLKTGSVPIAICAVIYLILSFKYPISTVDSLVMDALSSTYNISLWSAVPAIILLILPWLKVSVSNTILVSTVAAFFVAVFAQDMSFGLLLKQVVMGYTVDSEILGSIMSGGGIISMMEVVFIVVLSSIYCGIFEGTKMLESLKGMLSKASNKVSLYIMQIIISFATVAVFCNQTIATILSVQLLGDAYEEKGESKMQLAADIGNSLITIAAIVPWSIACAVPLAMMDVGSEVVLFSFFLYLNPICYFFTRKIFRLEDSGKGL